MREVTKRCMQCKHVQRDPAASPDQIIAGDIPHLCMESPPTTTPLLTPRGVIFMTCYPSITKDTLSCDRFACETTGA